MEEHLLWRVKIVQLSSSTSFVFVLYKKRGFNFFRNVPTCKCIQLFHKLTSAKTTYLSDSNRWITGGHNSIRITIYRQWLQTSLHLDETTMSWKVRGALWWTEVLEKVKGLGLSMLSVEVAVAFVLCSVLMKARALVSTPGFPALFIIET